MSKPDNKSMMVPVDLGTSGIMNMSWILVAHTEILPFVIPPEILIYGQRHFIPHDLTVRPIRYREAFAYNVPTQY